MIRPAAAMLSLIGLWFAAGVLVSFELLPLSWWGLFGGLCTVALLCDVLRLRRQASPELTRELDAVLPLGERLDVTLRLRHAGKRARRVRIHDMHPGGWRVEGLPRTVNLAP